MLKDKDKNMLHVLAAKDKTLKKSVWLVTRNSAGLYLLFKRSEKVNNPNTYGFLGGQCENLQPKEAIIKEVEEEGGFNPGVVTSIITLAGSNGKINEYFSCNKTITDKNIKPNYETNGWGWFSNKEIKNLNLHGSAKLFFKSMQDKKDVKIRSKLVKAELWQEILLLKNDIITASCVICVPSRKLLDLKVMPNFRGYGYSSILMQHIMGMDNYPTCLTASASIGGSLNTKQLVQFYSRYGFKPVVLASTGGSVPMILKETKCL